ncbi:hypothetical protein KCU83_g156, partial [Aureobasidium melanogenum]
MNKFQRLNDAAKEKDDAFQNSQREIIKSDDPLKKNIREASKSEVQPTSLLLQSQHAAIDKAIPASLSETELAHITLSTEQILFDSLLDLCHKLNNAFRSLGINIRDVESMHSVLDRRVQRRISFVHHGDKLFLQSHTGGVEFAVDVGVEGFVGVHEIVEGGILGSGGVDEDEAEEVLSLREGGCRAVAMAATSAVVRASPPINALIRFFAFLRSRFLSFGVVSGSVSVGQELEALLLLNKLAEEQGELSVALIVSAVSCDLPLFRFLVRRRQGETNASAESDLLVEKWAYLHMLEVAGVFGSWVIQGGLALGTVVLCERAVLPTEQFFGHLSKSRGYVESVMQRRIFGDDLANTLAGSCLSSRTDMEAGCSVQTVLDTKRRNSRHKLSELIIGQNLGTNIAIDDFRQQEDHAYCSYEYSTIDTFLKDIREYFAPTEFPGQAACRSYILHHAGTRPDEGVVPLVPIDTRKDRSTKNDVVLAIEEVGCVTQGHSFKALVFVQHRTGPFPNTTHLRLTSKLVSVLRNGHGMPVSEANVSS